jgi:hypothetical protein
MVELSHFYSRDELVAVRSGYSFGACEPIDLDRFDDHEWLSARIIPPDQAAPLRAGSEEKPDG